MLVNKLKRCASTFTRVGEKIYDRFGQKQFWRIQSSRCCSTVSNNGAWSVLFFGTDEFALKSLQTLHNSYKQDGLLRRLEIVTNYKGEENAVIKYAREHKITIHSWPPQIKEREFEIGVVVSFGHLIPSKLIALFPLGLINVHGSLLPRWRGAAPICHTLLNGDTSTGISIMKIMPKRFDIGSVIAKEEIEINPHDTYVDLYHKLAVIGANALIEVMKKLPDVLNTAVIQNENDVTYAPKINKEMSFIKWNQMNATNIYNLQRALTGIYTLRTYLNDQVVKLINIKAVPIGTTINCIKEKIPGLAIFDKKKKKLYVFCKDDSWIDVGAVIIPGRKPLPAAAFSSGFILNQKEKSCMFVHKNLDTVIESARKIVSCK